MWQVCFLAVMCASTGLARARDLRNVTEPRVPEACASLQASGGVDTAAIQKALDSCARGRVVALSAGTFRSGPLRVPSGVGLLVDSGATLKAIPDPRLYDRGTGMCGKVVDEGSRGACNPFILMHLATGSGLYGRGIIDGQGGEKLVGTNTTWWDLSRQAQVEGRYQNNPRLVQVNDCADITVHQVTLRDSPYFHLTASNTSGLTVWGVTVRAPAGARNTDAIDPNGSQNVTIARCDVSVGDDGVAISALRSPARHVSVLDCHFGAGNGLSIGSGTLHGVSDVLVSGVTLNNTLNGVHIKASSLNGGVVARVSYRDLCVLNVGKPVDLDMRYMNHSGDHEPHFRDISLRRVRVLTPGRLKLHGFSAANQLRVSLSDVHLARGSQWSVSYARISGSWADDASGRCGYAGNE
ncbi:endo-polygalacturonase-like isoform X2 [Bacillus rossius redtenbacheri]